MYRVDLGDRLDFETAGRLWSQSAAPLPFNHPGWWQSASDAFGARRRLTGVRVTAGGETVAVWAFWHKTLGARESFARIVEPVGCRVTDYVAPLVAPGHDPRAVVAAIAARMSEALDARTVLLLPKLQEEHLPRLEQSLPGRLVHVKPRTCWMMGLPATVNGLKQQWSKRLRGDVARQMRRLEAAGPVELRIARDRDEARLGLERLCRIHVLSWSARSGVSDLTAGSPMTRFLSRLVDLLPLPVLQFSELTVAGQTASAHLGFAAGSRLLWYKPAFDPAWGRYSPGKLHIAMAARSGIGDRRTEIDFLQGEEPYKLDWATGQRRTYSVAISSRLGYPFWAWTTRVRDMAAEYRY